MNLRLPAIVLALSWASCAAADGGRWVDNGNQTLTDATSGRVWTQRDNLKDINWADAKNYCGSLALDGAHWRLPGIDEVAALYLGGNEGSSPCGPALGDGQSCRVSPLFRLTGASFWSAEPASINPDTGSARAWLVNLGTGQRYPLDVSNAYTHRVLCVH